RPLNALENGIQARLKHFVVVWAAQAPFLPELHEADAAMRAAQLGELLRLRAQLRAQHVVHDRVNIQFRFDRSHDLLLLGAGGAQVHFLFLQARKRGQVNRRRIRAGLALHGLSLVRYWFGPSFGRASHLSSSWRIWSRILAASSYAS